MSTSPEDRIVALLSRWLARHLDTEQLRAAVEAAGKAGLSAGQIEAVDELLAELGSPAPGSRASLEPFVRETLEALALAE